MAALLLLTFCDPRFNEWLDLIDVVSTSDSELVVSLKMTFQHRVANILGQIDFFIPYL